MIIFLLICHFNKSYIAAQYFPQNHLTILTEVNCDRILSHQSAPGVDARVVLAPRLMTSQKKQQLDGRFANKKKNDASQEL